MINRNRLKGYMIMSGYTVPDAARAIGMPVPTMYKKLKNGVFTLPEVEAMIRAYHIDDPLDVFFGG